MIDWQKTIDDIMTVFRRQTDLVAALNKEYGEGFVTDSTISRIRNKKILSPSYDLGNALLIFHARYVRRNK